MNFEELDQKLQLGAFSTFDMEIMVPELLKLQSGQVYMEIGSDKGKSLSLAKLTAVSGVSLNAVDIARTPELQSYLVNNPDINFMWMRSELASKAWQDRGSQAINLLFIDGDHSYTGCKTDIDSWMDYMAPHGVVLFHDCDESSPGVMRAVAEYVDTHPLTEFKIFKRSDKNTSMAKFVL